MTINTLIKLSNSLQTHFFKLTPHTFTMPMPKHKDLNQCKEKTEEELILSSQCFTG